MTPLIVAIDGPSGVGKSTAARGLAERLGVPYLDTGAMYRAVALAMLDRGIPPADRERIEAEVGTVEVEVRSVDGQLRVLLAGDPVEHRIRTPEVGAASSQIATYRAVRRRLVELQQSSAGRHGAVVEGRDIATKVFPAAPFKFFFAARPEVRYQRRLDELRAAGRSVTPEQVEAEMAERDRRDQERGDSPLLRHPEAIEVDTSDRDAGQVVDFMLEQLRSANDHAVGAGRVD